MADNSFWDTFSSSFSSFADGVSDFFNVGATVSQSSNINADDVVKTKSALNAVGSYDVPDFGITDIPDMGMIDGLKNFQANNGLKVDGVMKPGGPTENALGQTLANQGLSSTDLLEKAKTPAITPKPDVPKPTIVSPPPQTSWSATAPLGEASKPKKPKLLKIDPMTGLVDPLASSAKGKMPTKKQWEEVAKMQKAKTAIVPEGETVDQRIRSMMSDKRYGDKNDTRLRDHVQKQFQRAYPGTVEYDETGKMVQPKAVIQPNDVEPFDPDGELTKQFTQQENDDGQTWRNSAMYEEGTLSEDKNQSENIRQGHTASASEVPQEELDPNQEVTLDSANEDNELMEVRDPASGKVYRVDMNGNYYDEKAVPVSLSDDVQQRLDQQFANDMQDDGFEENSQDHSYKAKEEGQETKEFNPDAFADTLRENSYPIGKGKNRCAEYVRRALETGGFPKYKNKIGSAKNWGPRLEENGFVPVDPDNYVPQKGDVVVIQPYPGGNRHGHMAAYDGKQWASDAKQRDMWGGPGYRKHKPPHVIYRKARQSVSFVDHFLWECTCTGGGNTAFCIP